MHAGACIAASKHEVVPRLLRLPDCLSCAHNVQRASHNTQCTSHITSHLSLTTHQASKPTFRLHLYVQLGCKRSSSGRAESSIASEVSKERNDQGMCALCCVLCCVVLYGLCAMLLAVVCRVRPLCALPLALHVHCHLLCTCNTNAFFTAVVAYKTLPCVCAQEHMSDNLSGSTPKSVAIAAATAAAAAIGSSSSNSTGTPRKGGGDDGQQQGSSSADSTGRGGGGGGGGGGGTASSQEAVDGSRGTQVTFTSSEYDELVEVRRT